MSRPVWVAGFEGVVPPVKKLDRSLVVLVLLVDSYWWSLPDIQVKGHPVQSDCGQGLPVDSAGSESKLMHL